MENDQWCWGPGMDLMVSRFVREQARRPPLKGSAGARTSSFTVCSDWPSTQNNTCTWEPAYTWRSRLQPSAKTQAHWLGIAWDREASWSCRWWQVVAREPASQPYYGCRTSRNKRCTSTAQSWHSLSPLWSDPCPLSPHTCCTYSSRQLTSYALSMVQGTSNRNLLHTLYIACGCIPNFSQLAFSTLNLDTFWYLQWSKSDSRSHLNSSAPTSASYHSPTASATHGHTWNKNYFRTGSSQCARRHNLTDAEQRSRTPSCMDTTWHSCYHLWRTGSSIGGTYWVFFDLNHCPSYRIICRTSSAARWRCSQTAGTECSGSFWHLPQY